MTLKHLSHFGIALASLAFPFQASADEEVHAAIEKGLAYLEKSQNPDGFWSSPDYPGLTGLAVQAFLLAPEEVKKSSDPAEEGLVFIRSHAKPNGGIYNKGLSNYNTSIALTTLLHAGDRKDLDLIEGARKYIADGQLGGRDKSSEDGGFGYEPEGDRSRPDLDNTLFALEAMALYEEKKPNIERGDNSGLNWESAIDFVTQCQNLKSANKAKWASDEPAEKGGFTYTPDGDGDGTHSYGTMTYSGLLSLIHADVDAEDERVKAAIEWLALHYSVDSNPGKGKDGLYYYYFVMAKALTAAELDELPKKDGTSVDWRKELSKKLLSLQKENGSWANEAGRWMEKDPNLVTSYVVLALNTIATGN